MKITTSVNSVGAGLGFNGELHEPGTGWQILGNGYRVYNPALMRFHSPDSLSPFGQGGMNAYAYCNGDPVNAMDPTGHAVRLQLSWGKYFFRGSKLAKSRVFQQSRVLAMVDDTASSVIKVAAKSDIVDTLKAVKARNLKKLNALEGKLKKLSRDFKVPETLSGNTGNEFNELYAMAQARHQKVNVYSGYLESVEVNSGNLYITARARDFLSRKALKLRGIETWRAAHRLPVQGKLKVE